MRVVTVEKQKYNTNPMSRIEHLLKNGSNIGGDSEELPDDKVLATEEDIDDMFTGNVDTDHNFDNANDLNLPDGYGQATKDDIDAMFN